MNTLLKIEKYTRSVSRWYSNSCPLLLRTACREQISERMVKNSCNSFAPSFNSILNKPRSILSAFAVRASSPVTNSNRCSNSARTSCIISCELKVMAFLLKCFAQIHFTRVMLDFQLKWNTPIWINGTRFPISMIVGSVAEGMPLIKL